MTAPERPARILVVEDEPLLLCSLFHALRDEGHQAILATSHRDALRKLDLVGGPVDLLLTDVLADGTKLGELVLAVKPSPVIYMSGLSRQVHIEAGRIPPDATLLEKPFSPDALFACIAEALSPARPSPRRGWRSTTAAAAQRPPASPRHPGAQRPPEASQGLPDAAERSAPS